MGSALLWFVALYLMVSVGIGLFAATRVHNAKDFAVAGRSLPLPVVTATVFATWFGAEAVFGASATFVRDGLGGVVADPFGSSMCLVLAGILFSTFLYKLNILTLGDFYRMRYSRTVETLTTICIVLSYLGWVAAQIMALGLIFNVVSDGAISQNTGMILGTCIVLTYTVFGGMFSVAVLDFVQMAVSMGGLFFIAWIVSGKNGGVAHVIEHASLAGKLDFFPKGDIWAWVSFLGAWVTMMLGSIPQQDVFQRITSAKTAKVALWGSVLGASIYFCFCFVPMYIAYSATLIDPAQYGTLLASEAPADYQRAMPLLVLQHTPLFAQVIFFGAVLSAIMSCSSATLLAPSVTFAENVIRSRWPGMSDRHFLWVMRATIVGFASAVLTFALNSELSIFEMVESAYKITLAGAFVPLICGILWKRATNQGALAAIFGGILGWLLVEFMVGDESLVPPQLIGLAISFIGMIAGSLLPQWVAHTPPMPDAHAAMRHHAAAMAHHTAHHTAHHSAHHSEQHNEHHQGGKH